MSAIGREDDASDLKIDACSKQKKAERGAHFARMQAAAVASTLSPDDARKVVEELAEGAASIRKRRLTLARKIIAAGYYYSGSGALLDFVADHEGAMSWPREGEVRFINLPWGVKQFYEDVASHGVLEPQAIVRLYLHLFGKMPADAFPPGETARLARIANRTNRQAIRSDLGKAHTYAAKEAISALAGMVGHDAAAVLPVLAKLFQRYDSELRRLSGASVVAYDRAIPPYDMGRVALLGKNAVIVAVHRDPRSQFVDITHARAERNQSVMSAEKFIRLIRSRRKRARSCLLRHPEQFDDTVALIAFEELVTSDALREKLRGLLGLEEVPYLPARMLPEVSQKNMSNYERHPDQGAIREIEQALPEYLWPSGEQCGSYVMRRPVLELLGE